MPSNTRNTPNPSLLRKRFCIFSFVSSNRHRLHLSTLLAAAPAHGARHVLLQPPVNAIRVEHVLAVRNHLHRLSLSDLLQTYRAIPLPRRIRHHRQRLLRHHGLRLWSPPDGAGLGLRRRVVLLEVEKHESDEEEGGEEDEEHVGNARSEHRTNGHFQRTSYGHLRRGSVCGVFGVRKRRHGRGDWNVLVLHQQSAVREFHYLI